MPKKIEISHRTIVYVIVFLAALWLVSRIWDIIMLVFIAVILMSALKPAVDFLERMKIPRAIGITVVYILLWSLIATAIASLVPALIEQTRKLVIILPQALSNVEYLTDHQQEITSQVLANVGAIPESVFRLSVSIFSNFINVVAAIVISFYLLLERQHLDAHVSSIFGENLSPQAKKIILQIETKLGGWIRGEIILMTSIGLMTYFGLRLLGLDTALPLAILAGLLEIIPTIGPIVSAVPAVIIALVINPLMGLSVAGLYFLVQFFENNVLVPQVMRKAAGVNPLISLLGLMIGFRLGGTVGAILAIPAILVIQVLGLEFFSISRLEKLSE